MDVRGRNQCLTSTGNIRITLRGERCGRRYRDLYLGGEQFRLHAPEYLVRRQKEPGEVYSERLSRVFYENYIGSIVDWYAATLMRQEPVLTFEGPNEAGKKFFAEFVEDCDRKETQLNEFFRQQFIESAGCGRQLHAGGFSASGGAGADPGGGRRLGRVAGVPGGLRGRRSHQLELRRARELEWVVIRTQLLQEGPAWRTRMADGDAVVYYDKRDFPDLLSTQETGRRARRGWWTKGTHGLANCGRCRCSSCGCRKGLWLMNKAALAATGALQQVERAGVGADDGAVRDAGGLLGPGVEPDGGRELLHPTGAGRQVRVDGAGGQGLPDRGGQPDAAEGRDLPGVLSDAAGGRGAGQGDQQSGLSKQMDFAMTQEVLRAYGDAVKDAMRQVLRAIAAARQDGLAIDVTGMDEFDIADFSTELADAQEVAGAGDRVADAEESRYSRSWR